jgi:DNA-binding CsgD family transcriptional regulator/tetratricopeptide (TPR) repeat protein
MSGMSAAGALLERERELEALRCAWDGVRQGGRGEVVLVRGEAGSGKTVLLDAFCAGLTAPVWTGACHPLSTPRPLGPFAEVAERVGGELARVVTGEGRPHEVAGALARVAADGPAVVILEDLHWADDASLDVLRMLVRPLRDRALLVVVSYRDDEVERCSALQEVLGDLSGPGTSRLDVPPLSADAVRALSRGTRRDPVELHRLTGGNAFFVTEALAVEDEAIPSTIVDAALARLARLRPEARAVAEAVAVVPQLAELWLVEALADVTHLDEAVAGGVLVAHADGVTFRHELARLAVEGTLPPYQRVVLHRKALAALGARPASDAARLAHHAEAAQDSPAVVVHAQRAGDRAARLGSKREAAAHYEQALRHVAEPVMRADLLEQFSYACYLVDRMAEAVTALEEALEIRRQHDDRLGEGRVLNNLSRRLSCAGRELESPATIERAVQVLEQLPPSSELAQAYALRCYTCFESGDVAGTHKWGWRAIELAEEVGAVDVVVYALNNMGSMELFQGRDPELLLRSLDLAREHGLDEAVGRAVMHLTGAYADQRRLDQLDMLDEGVAECERRGLVLWLRYVITDRAQMYANLGRWDDAVDAVSETVASPRSAPLLRVFALCVTAKVRLRRGDPGGREALAEARALAEGHPGIDWWRMITLLEAEIAWYDGATAEEMAALTDRTLDLARLHDEQWTIDELLRWRRLAGVLDEPTTGRTLFSTPSPVDRWRELGSGFETAMGLLENGEPIEALALLQMIGAAGTAARVARDLREQGVRELPRGPRTSTRANPAQLTDRELDVLLLVAEGLPNSAIADRLVLSTKTVDKHVSAALRKLDVRSRAEARAKAEELGLTATV